MNLLVCPHGNVEAAYVDLLLTMKDLPAHVELVLIDKHPQLLDHVANIIVSHQGNVDIEAAFVDLLLAVKDFPEYVELVLIESICICWIMLGISLCVIKAIQRLPL